jgi:hypothetical protein
MPLTVPPNPSSDVTPAPRHDFYAGVHKGLRSFMADTLVAAGRADPADPQDVDATLSQLRGLLAICATHLEHENRFVHTAMEARCPGSSARTGEDHVAHEAAIDELIAAIGAVERACGAARAGALHALYGRLAQFVAENFEHMRIEETANNAVLWAHYTDEELAAIEHAIVGSIPPADMGAFLRWMIPALSHAERVAMLNDMAQGAPRDVFEAVLGIARARLSARDWAKLEGALAAHA